jgi:ATP-dependent exoDNAse (exonuclease V) beta subunit
VVFVEKHGARRVEIFDFKTNRRRPDESEDDFARRMAETYKEQMSDYRRACMQLTGLPAAAVRCTLLLTATRQAVTVAE